MPFKNRNLQVRCDKAGCGWTKDIAIDEVRAGMTCDRCGSIVINESDMQTVRKIQKTLKFDRLWKSIVPKKFHKNVEVRVETQRLEGGETEEEITITNIKQKGKKVKICRHCGRPIVEGKGVWTEGERTYYCDDCGPKVLRKKYKDFDRMVREALKQALEHGG